MPAASMPLDETARLNSLKPLGILDAKPDEEFSALARAASLACNAPISFISLIDNERQWFKALYGSFATTEMPRDIAFCGYTILSDDILEVEDAREDPRFVDNPLVQGSAKIRFYAGVPLRLSSGDRIGALCVLDTRPNRLNNDQRGLLRCLALAATRSLENIQYVRLHREALDKTMNSKRQLNALLASTVDHAAYYLDLEGRVKTWHAGGQSIKGYKADDVIGNNFSMFFTPEDIVAEEPARLLSVALSTGMFRGQGWRLRSDGSRFFARINITTVHDEEGDPCGFVKVEHDIHNEELMRRLLDSVDDHAMYMLDPHGLVASWNRGAEAIKGYTSSEIVGQSFEVFFTEEDRAAGLPTHLLRLAREEGQFQTESWRVRKDGTRFWARIVIKAIRDTDGLLIGFTKIAHDITRRQTEEAQRAIMIEAAPNGMLIINEDGNITLANHQAEQIFGYAKGGLAGQSIDTLLSEELLAQYKMLRDGLQATGDMSAVILQDRQFAGRRRDGTTVLIEFLLRPVLTPRGTTMVAWVYDSTERVRLSAEREAAEAERMANDAETKATLEKLSAHLAKARDLALQANEAKSRFLISTTHELRTPLHGILGYAQLLRDDGTLNDAQRKRVQAMQDAGQHLLGMINAVLDLSQIESDRIELQAEEVDLRIMANQCLAIVSEAARAKRLSINASMDTAAPLVIMTDASRLHQIIVNLLGNAVNFTDAGGVELRFQKAFDGIGVRIEVLDTGRGVAACDRETIFSNFGRSLASTVDVAKGAGFGLAIATRLVQRMGGTIGYRDNLGGGSVFWMELPVVWPPKTFGATLPLMTQTKEKKAETLRILVVDDMELNRDITKAFLESAGHEVVCADGGAVAVEAVAASEFHLVLMDLRMPDVDGFEATRRIRELGGVRAQVPILALTAQAFAEQIDECGRAGMVGHVAKPFSQATLIAAVHEATQKVKAGTMSDYTVASAKAAFSALPILDEAGFAASTGVLEPKAVTQYCEQITKHILDLEAELRGRAEGSTFSAEFLDNVHALAGQCGMLGFMRIAAITRHFERAARSGASDAHLLAQVMHAAMIASRVELEMKLASSSGFVKVSAN